MEQTLTGEKFGETDVRTAVTLLANHGLAMPLRFGNLVLMRPELLNGYAGAVIRAARKHVDEIGCVREQDVFECRLGFRRRRPPGPGRRGTAACAPWCRRSSTSRCASPRTRRKDGTWYFPSQYRRERPFPTDPEVFISYTFTGELQTVYTTLVVRLWYSREFDHKELWRNAAEFLTSKSRTVGLAMQKTGDGQGTINVFFESGVPDELKVAFIEYVTPAPGEICPRCHARPALYLREVQHAGEGSRTGPQAFGRGEGVRLLSGMRQEGAVSGSHRAAAGPRSCGAPRPCHGADGEARARHAGTGADPDRPHDGDLWRGQPDLPAGHDVRLRDRRRGRVQGQRRARRSGRKIYVQLKSGESYLRTRKGDGKEVFDVQNPRHIEAWVSQQVDVYLVIRDAEEAIRWMNVTQFLKTRADKQSRQIVFDGEKLDAPAVWRMRDAVMAR